MRESDVVAGLRRRLSISQSTVQVSVDIIWNNVLACERSVGLFHVYVCCESNIGGLLDRTTR